MTNQVQVSLDRKATSWTATPQGTLNSISKVGRALKLGGEVIVAENMR